MGDGPDEPRWAARRQTLRPVASKTRANLRESKCHSAPVSLRRYAMDQGANSGSPFLLFYAVRAIRIPLPARARKSSETAGSTNRLARSRLAAALPSCAEKTARSESRAALAGSAARPSRALRIRHEKAERYQNQERIQGLKMPLGAGSTKTIRYENRSEITPLRLAFCSCLAHSKCLHSGS